MRLGGKVCIVTGAASGIGQAIAHRFLLEGARVSLIDIDADLPTSITGLPLEQAERAHAEVGSVDDPGFVSRAVDAVCRRWHGVDCLVTSAAISTGGIATATSDADWDRVFSVNVKGTFLWCKAVLPHLAKQGGGSIITIASQLALSGGRGNASYVASKGAVLSLTRSIALDYAAQGVRCNALVPAAIETPLLRRSFGRQPDPPAAEARSIARHPLGRFGRTEEVASAAVFLASDESSFTTGSILPVDGGWLAA